MPGTHQPNPLNQARHWARRVKRNQSPAGKAHCVRRTLDALYASLPPCRDGHHPLDADRLKLEG